MGRRQEISEYEINRMIEMRKSGMSISEIAFRCHIGHSRLTKMIGHIKPDKTRLRIDWKQYDTKLLDLARQGLKYDDISDHLGIPKKRVSARLYVLRSEGEDIPYQQDINRYAIKGIIRK